MIESLLSGYPIRLSPDHRICAPPRSFSQLITAFFAGRLQDIHHKPILRLTILFSLLKRSSFLSSFPLPGKTQFHSYLKLILFTLFSYPPAHFPFNIKKTHLQVVFLSLPSSFKEQCVAIKIFYAALLEIRGFEPLTYGLQSRRSSQLSYIPLLQTNNIKKGGKEEGK